MNRAAAEGLNFQISSGPSASQPATGNMKFERADWTSFRIVEGLQQKAGVPSSKLRRLVLKELADNAPDAGGKVPDGARLARDIEPLAEQQPDREWRDAIEAAADIATGHV
jgi:hypothetical protein